MIFYLLCSISKNRKVNRILVTVLLAVLPVIFLIEFFLKQTFGFYYSIADILSNTKQVAGSYSGSILLMIAKSWYVIVLYFVPLVLYALVGRYFVPADGARPGHRVIAAGVCVLCYLFALIGVMTGTAVSGEGNLSDRNCYRAMYDADRAGVRFGLLTALRLDVQYGIFGVPEESTDTDMDDISINIGPGSGTTSSDPASTPVSEPASNPSSDPEPPIPQGDNVLKSLDFAALAAGEKDKTVKQMHEYFGAQTPSAKNRYTGLCEGKNLIIIVAEAFSSYVIDAERTPMLYQLANSGVVARDYYQPCWGQSTSGGEFSALLGQIPTRKNEKEKGLSMYLGRNNNWYYSMGQVLRRSGYMTLAFHNNTYDYYDRDETHDNLGYQYYGKIDGVMGRTYPKGQYANLYEKFFTEQIKNNTTALLPDTVSNGIDKDMIDSTISYYIDREPFHIYYLTMSGHNNYSMSNSKAVRNAAYVQNLNFSDTVKAYLAYQQELEWAMQALVHHLEAAGKAENTVICLTADHYPYGLDNGAFGNTADYTGELMGKTKYSVSERDRNALILWYKGMPTVEVTKPVSSVDILPTLLNLFGVEYDSRILPGRDMLSDAEGLVVFADYSWVASRGSLIGGTFTAAPNAGFASNEEARAYMKETNQKAKDQVEYSRYIRQKDYYRILFGNN